MPHDVLTPTRWQQTYEPSQAEVDALMSAAQSHPLGVDFLRHGQPDALAATFGVHAFVVDAARDQLS